MCDNILITYAYISALYEDEEKDYIDTFWPFVLNVMPTNQDFLSLKKIQTLIDDEYGLHIPLGTLKTICNRAKRLKYLSLKNHKFQITTEGLAHKARNTSEENIQKGIDFFVDDGLDYIETSFGFSLLKDDFIRELSEFIEHNIYYFCRYFNVPTNAQINPVDASLEQALLSYINTIDETDENQVNIHLQSLRRIIRGSIISLIIYQNDISQAERNFGKTRFFLDSNFIFSLMGLHHDEFSFPAQELHKLLLENDRFELFVFDFTVDEIIRVLAGYPRAKGRYLSAIDVSSIYDAMKKNKWTKTKITETIADLENIFFRDFNIKIKVTDINLDEYNSENPNILEHLQSYKDGKSKKNLTHDVAAIEWIHRHRRGRVNHIEEAGYLFLTSDKKLTLFSINEWKHDQYRSISEVVLDSVLTNILWLKSPHSMRKLPINSILSTFSQGLLVDHNVWESFIDTLTEEIENDNLDIDSLLLILSDAQTKNLLLSESNGEVIANQALQTIDQDLEQFNAEKNQLIETAETAQVKANLVSAKKEKSQSRLEKISLTIREMERKAKRKFHKKAKCQIKCLLGLNVLLLNALIITIVIIFWDWLLANLTIVKLMIAVLGIVATPFIFKVLGLSWDKHNAAIDNWIRKRSEKLYSESEEEKQISELRKSLQSDNQDDSSEN